MFRSRQEVKDDAQRKIMEDLDRAMVASKRDARFVKSELDRLTVENQKFISAHEGSTSAQMRKNLLNTHARHFQQVCANLFFIDIGSVFTHIFSFGSSLWFFPYCYYSIIVSER